MDNLNFFEQFILMFFIGTPIFLLIIAWVCNTLADMMLDISSMTSEDVGGIAILIILTLILTVIYF